MTCRPTLNLIDPDMRRRAAVSFALVREGWHVEPHESVAELALAPPCGGALLVADEPDLVPDVLALAATACPDLPVIPFHPAPEPRRIVAAVRYGAHGYLAHPFDTADLELVLDDADRRSRQDNERRDPLRALTPREREIFEAAASGMTSRTIGLQLEISRRTVDAHRVNLLNKMGVNTIAEAVRLARGGAARGRLVRAG